MTQLNIQQTLEQAVRHHQAGKLEAAEKLYRQVLAWQPRHADALHLLGLIALQVGSLDVAAQLISSAIAIEPAAPQYHGNLGQVRASQGRFEEAIASYQQALRLQPDIPEVHNNIGGALVKMGRLDEAIAAFNRALALRADLPEGHYNLGIAFQSSGRLEEGIASLRKAVQLRPGVADYHNNLGNALQAAGKSEEAIEQYQNAIVLRHDDADAFDNLASALRQLGRFDEAISTFRQALAIRPSFPEGLNNLGCAFQEAGRHEEAIAAFRQALAIRPDYAEAHYNLGNSLLSSGALDESSAEFSRALNLRSNYADAYVGLANVRGEQRQIDDAIKTYRKAIAAEPENAVAHNNLAMMLLLRGDFDEGWREHEWRWKMKRMAPSGPTFAQPLWNGQELNGRRILLHVEQGFGDAIQFVRYMPQVIARGGRVILQSHPELLRLFNSVGGVEQIIARGQPLPEFDMQCPLATLPLLFKTTPESIPWPGPYLSADPELSSRWCARMTGEKAKVGIAWAGRAMPDPDRSIAFELLHPLLDQPNMSRYSLQKLNARSATPSTASCGNLIDWTEELRDFADTAALIDSLDLVITVDTVIAHLAGAMGKRVWVLLKQVPDWRWMLDRDDSPWYPSMRLFRQPSRGDWGGAIQKLAQELQCLK